MSFKLYEFQNQAVALLLEKKWFLLAYQMGLGKTIIALKAAEILNLQTIVICPAFMRNTWERAIAQFKIRDIRIISWSQVIELKCRVLIVDESHYAKNPEALRTRAFLKLADKVRELGGYVWLLSGTPAKNTAAELYCQLEAIGLTGYGYEKFAEEFAESYMAQYGVMQKPTKKYRGVKNIEALRKLYAPLMKVMRTEEALELPIQIKKEIMSGLSVFKEDDVAEFRSDAESFIKKNFATKKLQQARMNMSVTKSLVEDLRQSFDKIVVFSDHVEPAQDLATHFECGVITGEVPIKRRDEVIDAFRDGKSDVLCCTIGAAGVGLNLQFAHCMVFNDLPWVPGDLMQAEKRIHRIGQSQRCHYFYVLDPGMGEVIYNTLQNKISKLESIK